MKVYRKAVFVLLGSFLLCLPATAWAEPLDSGFLDDPALSESIQDSELDSIIKDLENPEAIDAPYLSKDVAHTDKELLIGIGASSGIKLTPGALYSVYLEGSLLMTHPADQNGQFFLQIKLPAGLPETEILLEVRGASSLNISKHIRIFSD